MIPTLLRQRLWLLAVAAMAVAGAAGGAFAAADGPSASKVTKLHFLLREEDDVIVDRAPKGPSKGDIVVIRGDLLNAQTRTPVGTELGYCVGIDNVEGRAVCTATLAPAARTALAKAEEIFLSGVFDTVPEPPQISAITGGTGRYQQARGQVVATDGPSGLVDLVLTLER
jgi:hypothetical protein